MDLFDIFKAVAVIHKEPYPVVAALVQNYPPNHFSMAFQESMNGDILENPAIDRSMAKLDSCIKECVNKYQESMASFIFKTSWIETYKKDTQNELKKIKTDFNEELERQQEYFDKKVLEFERQQRIRDAANSMMDAKQLKVDLDSKTAECEQLKNQVDMHELKLAFTKWFIHNRILKFIDETQASETDYEMDLEEERRDLYRQQCMTDLMGFQQTLARNANSL